MDVQLIEIFVSGAFLGALLGRLLTFFVLSGGLVVMLIFNLI
jgi:hypothetical protein